MGIQRNLVTHSSPGPGVHWAYGGIQQATRCASPSRSPVSLNLAPGGINVYSVYSIINNPYIFIFCYIQSTFLLWCLQVVAWLCTYWLFLLAWHAFLRWDCTVSSPASPLIWLFCPFLWPCFLVHRTRRAAPALSRQSRVSDLLRLRQILSIGHAHKPLDENTTQWRAARQGKPPFLPQLRQEEGIQKDSLSTPQTKKEKEAIFDLCNNNIMWGRWRLVHDH